MVIVFYETIVFMYMKLRSKGILNLNDLDPAKKHMYVLQGDDSYDELIL